MGRDGDRGPLPGLRGHSRFSHTSNAVYLTAFFALCCVGYDSTHVSTVAGGAMVQMQLPHCRRRRCLPEAPAPAPTFSSPLHLLLAGHHPAVAHQPEVVLSVWWVGPPPPALCCCLPTATALGNAARRNTRCCHCHPSLNCAGAMCMFAYLYVRPLIRRRLGSASRGYINFTTIYIGESCWGSGNMQARAGRNGQSRSTC